MGQPIDFPNILLTIPLISFPPSSNKGVVCERIYTISANPRRTVKTCWWRGRISRWKPFLDDCCLLNSIQLQNVNILLCIYLFLASTPTPAACMPSHFPDAGWKYEARVKIEGARAKLEQKAGCNRELVNNFMCFHFLFPAGCSVLKNTSREDFWKR